jgi:CheY-like chemotaxis protein
LARSASGFPLLNRSPILIVEDEPFIALELQALVEDAGGQVVGPVGSANAALTLLQTCVVGAAILDVQLSDRDVTPVAEALVALGVPMFFRAPSAFRRTFSSDTQCDRLPKAGFGRATA